MLGMSTEAYWTVLHGVCCAWRRFAALAAAPLCWCGTEMSFEGTMERGDFLITGEERNLLNAVRTRSHRFQWPRSFSGYGDSKRDFGLCVG